MLITPWVLALVLSAAPEPQRRITLDLSDANIHNVFRLLADVGKVNVVVPDEVKGKVSLKLVDVPWNEALLVVLESKGLGVVREGNIYYVDTLEALTKRAEAKAKLEASRKKTAPLKTVMIALSYAKAKDMVPIVKAMLTERGSVEVDARTNVLIVTDVAGAAEEVKAALEGER